MLIITIRTDKPDAEVGLYEDSKQLAYETWTAHRQLAETLHRKLAALLQQCGKDWPDLQGIVAFKGPGSFTGLRIGLTVADTLAYGLQIPIVGAENPAWLEHGIAALQDGHDDHSVLPEYGAPVHITLPKH